MGWRMLWCLLLTVSCFLVEQHLSKVSCSFEQHLSIRSAQVRA